MCESICRTINHIHHYSVAKYNVAFRKFLQDLWTTNIACRKNWDSTQRFLVVARSSSGNFERRPTVRYAKQITVLAWVFQKPWRLSGLPMDLRESGKEAGWLKEPNTRDGLRSWTKPPHSDDKDDEVVSCGFEVIARDSLNSWCVREVLCLSFCLVNPTGETKGPADKQKLSDEPPSKAN